MGYFGGQLFDSGLYNVFGKYDAVDDVQRNASLSRFFYIILSCHGKINRAESRRDAGNASYLEV